MKTLLCIVAICLLSLTAQAQSTNVQSLRLTYVDGSGTNNTTINLDSNESQGFVLNYLTQVQTANQASNTPPTFQNAIRQTTRTMLLTPLSIQAQADDWKTNKLDVLFTYGPALRNAGVFTAAQKQALKDIVTSPNVATNLPAQ